MPFYAVAKAPLKLAEGSSSPKSRGRWVPAEVAQQRWSGGHGGVFGCGRPAPGGFPVPLWLTRACFRLQEEMLQREEAESTLQSFRQVCRFCSHSQPPDASHPRAPRAILKVTLTQVYTSCQTSRLRSKPPSGRKTTVRSCSGQKPLNDQTVL